MKLINYVLILIIGAISLSGCGSKEEISIEEKECYVQMGDDWALVTLSTGPVYLDGGESGWHNNIIGQTNYPSEARENRIEGIAIVQYEITIDGTVENLVILQDPGTGIGEETRRVVDLATQDVPFTPAILNEVPVRVRKTYELVYQIR